VVLSELRAKETRLRGAGLLGVSLVLADLVATVLAASRPSRSSAPLLLATAPNGMGRSPSGGGGRPSHGGGRSRLLVFSVTTQIFGK
jgi:hypothetical protein